MSLSNVVDFACLYINSMRNKSLIGDMTFIFLESVDDLDHGILGILGLKLPPRSGKGEGEKWGSFCH
jgi:hypothetical protein